MGVSGGIYYACLSLDIQISTEHDPMNDSITVLANLFFEAEEKMTAIHRGTVLNRFNVNGLVQYIIFCLNCIFFT